MNYSTIVRVVREGSGQPVAGARVSLFDRDHFLKNDVLGTGETDARGEVRFSFTSDDFVDLDDRLTGTFPDLLAVVYAADGSEVARNDVVPNTALKILTLTVPAGASFGGAAPAAPAEPEPAA